MESDLISSNGRYLLQPVEIGLDFKYFQEVQNHAYTLAVCFEAEPIILAVFFLIHMQLDCSLGN